MAAMIGPPSVPSARIKPTAQLVLSALVRAGLKLGFWTARKIEKQVFSNKCIVTAFKTKVRVYQYLHSTCVVVDKKLIAD